MDLSPSSPLYHVLEDLCARFLVNLPSSEFESFERLFFTIESAYWFYDDFRRDEDPSLPRLQLKSFAKLLFNHTPLLQPYRADVERLLKEFRSYKQEVPTCGAAMLNPAMDQVVLVKSWGHSARWTFPKGKMAKGETEDQAAIREVLEETGYDVSSHINSNDYIDSMEGGRCNRIFIATNVPLDTHFETKTRKEISRIEWKYLRSLPDTFQKEKQNRNSHQGNYTGVVPYVRRLASWVKRQKKKKIRKNTSLKNQPMTESSNGCMTKHYRAAPFSEEGVTSDSRIPANASSASRQLARVTDKDISTFGNSCRMTPEDRNNFFEEYVKEADKRALEMGIDDDDWPVPVITSKDLIQRNRLQDNKRSMSPIQDRRLKQNFVPRSQEAQMSHTHWQLSSSTQRLSPSTVAAKQRKKETGRHESRTASKKPSRSPARKSPTRSPKTQVIYPRRPDSENERMKIKPIRLLKRPPQNHTENENTNLVSVARKDVHKAPQTNGTLQQSRERAIGQLGAKWNLVFDRTSILRCLT